VSVDATGDGNAMSGSRSGCRFGSLCEKRHLKATGGILLAFAIGLVLFFMLAAELGDGLERTMEEGEAEESSGYESPLSYGEDYPGSLMAGIIGFLIVLVIVMGYGKLREHPDET